MQEDVRSAVPRTDHQEEVALTFQGEDGSKSDLQEEDGRAVADRSPKPNRRSPRAGFLGGRGFRRHLLSRYSMRAEVRDGERQSATEMWSLGSEGRERRLTEDFLFYACGREGESQRRNSGVGDMERR